MFSICIWFNKWLVQLLCGISQVPKYVQLVFITASKIPLGTFFLWKPSTITSSKSELSKGVQDLRNKEVNKKAYQKSDQSWKNQVTKCLSNQHIGKTISPKISIVLETSIKLTNYHQWHRNSIKLTNYHRWLRNNSINSNNINMRLSGPNHFSRSQL